jgi:hypothetical protein
VREIFRHLDVTRRYTLKVFCDELYISRGFGVRVYRVTKLKKRQKWKNGPPKMVVLAKMDEKSPKIRKSSPANQAL